MITEADSQAVALTREWVRQIVIGEGLCPFAAPVFDQLLIETHLTEDENELTDLLMALMQRLVSTPDSELPTALFVTPNAFHDFDRYWNWFDICDRLLTGMGHEGVIQLASFHPRYCFEGEDESDLSHCTNRSPYPMIHIIREQDIDRALASVSSPERIPERNRRHMRRLGYQGLVAAMPALAGWISDNSINDSH